MLSALGIIIGLASRAPLTFFDEPYLGLDAVARQLFYDRLLTDFSEHPRTVVLSTHLIDEVSALIEHVLLIDRGRIVLDDEVEAVRGQLLTVSGASRAVDEFAAAGTELHRTTLNGTARVTLRGAFVPADHDRARSLGLRVEAESLQELVVRLTASPRRPADAETAGDSPEKEILR